MTSTREQHRKPTTRLWRPEEDEEDARDERLEGLSEEPSSFQLSDGEMLQRYG